MTPADPARRRLLLAGACLAAWPLGASATQAPRRLRASRALMGTRVDVAAQGPDAESLQRAIDAAFARMTALSALMSHYAPTSQVSAIGLAAGLQPVEVAPELMQVLHMARDVARRTDGAFDPPSARWGCGISMRRRSPPSPRRRKSGARLPSVDWRHLVLDERRQTAYLTERGMRLDLGGIAKLSILQSGLDTLQAHGVRTALVNGGGDVVASRREGMRPGGSASAIRARRSGCSRPSKSAAASSLPRATTNVSSCRTAGGGTMCWIRAPAGPPRACAASRWWPTRWRQ
jgi:thiamine biosynthesis lipoprotein